jgi:exopolyphosphatase/guanosine-5'-triphosphate,3'-diphosphate pyrophosphatase
MTRVAAIDCGTNSIRLLIADIEGENFREIYRTMEIVRLGQGVDKTKAFHPDALHRTLTAVAHFADEIARRGVQKIRFCASGEEEARLSFLGATKELKGFGAPYLVIDIGGGSTEFVFGSTSVESAKSQNIGCVRMSERHFSALPPSEGEISKARVDIDDAIREAAEFVPITQAKTVIAVAGTATTVAAAALELEQYDRYSIHLSRISAQATHEIANSFLAMSRDNLSALPFMHPGRIDVIAAGALVLSRIMEFTGAPEFVASESDILDGMAWSLAN